jgi:hypothetical protein
MLMHCAPPMQTLGAWQHTCAPGGPHSSCLMLLVVVGCAWCGWQGQRRVCVSVWTTCKEDDETSGRQAPPANSPATPADCYLPDRAAAALWCYRSNCTAQDRRRRGSLSRVAGMCV